MHRLHPLDRHILRVASRRFEGRDPAFEDAVEVLCDVVARAIPGGRLFVLADTPEGPVVGSHVSRVGVVSASEGIAIVRVAGGATWTIGWFVRARRRAS